MAQDTDKNFLIEFVRIGNSVKVTAIDPVTGQEACIIGPASLSEVQLSQNAIAKLRYVLAKNKPGQPSRKPL